MSEAVRVVLALLAVAAVAAAEGTYSDRWDNINVDEILQSQRLLNNYMKCLLEEGRCTSDANDLKKMLPDALENDCSKCTETQKKNANKVVDFLMENKPDEWTSLEKKYDPNGEYRRRYDALKAKA